MFFEGETKQRSNFFKNGFSFTFNTTFNHSFIQEGAFVGLTVEQCCRLIKKRKEITMILCTATLCTYVQVRSKQGGGNQPPPPGGRVSSSTAPPPPSPAVPAVCLQKLFNNRSPPRGEGQGAAPPSPCLPSSSDLTGPTGPPQKSSSSQMSR